MTTPAKWPVHPVKIQSSLGICPAWSVLAVQMKKLPLKGTPKTDQTGSMPNWSESTLGTHVILLFLSYSCSITIVHFWTITITISGIPFVFTILTPIRTPAVIMCIYTVSKNWYILYAKEKKYKVNFLYHENKFYWVKKKKCYQNQLLSKTKRKMQWCCYSYNWQQIFTTGSLNC